MTRYWLNFYRLLQQSVEKVQVPRHMPCYVMTTQQRLKVLDYGKIKEQKADAPHDQKFPAKIHNARRVQDAVKHVQYFINSHSAAPQNSFACNPDLDESRRNK